MSDTEHLRRRRSPLVMDAAAFREVGHRLVDDIGELFETLGKRPVNRDVTPEQVRARLPAGGLPERGSDPAALLAQVWQQLADQSLFNGHPRFLAYITSPAAPIGVLAEMMAAAINPNCGGWQLSPVASEIEGQCVRWIAEMLGFPGDHGLLVSGGNMANIACFLAARRARGEPELRAQGVQPARGRMRAYVSAETHTWVQKAADIAGLGTDAIAWIATDDDLRMDAAALERQIVADKAAGERPFLVVATSGTVSTGAIDPLREIAAVAREHGLWFHVDGAYGALARVVPEVAASFDGLERADSVAVDPHKWLYAPLEAGCVLVRDPDALRDTFSYTPSYYRFDGEEEEPRTNYYELGLQNSRGFRALKVWLALRQVGRAGYREMIGDDIALARILRSRIDATPGLESGPGDLSIATFRALPPSGERDEVCDRFNEQLLARLKASGELFVSNAVIGGRFYLRACVCNFRTALEDIEAIPEIVLRHASC